MSSPFDTWPDLSQPSDADAPPPEDGAPPPDDSAPVDRAAETEGFVRWVGEQLAKMEGFGVEKRGEVPWCPRWWEHPEVVQRLYVSWQAHGKAVEQTRDGDLQALSQWWIYHWDHHAAKIFDRTRGPLRFCTPKEHHGDGAPKQVPFVTVATPDSGWTL